MVQANTNLIEQTERERPEVDYWLRMYDQVQAERSVWDGHWGEVARRIYPESDQFRTFRTPGTKVRQEVFSSHGSRALRKSVRIHISLSAPKTSQWHKLTSDNDDVNKDPAAKQFFEELTRRAFRLRLSPRARFYETLTPSLMDFLAFGNCCFFIEETVFGPMYMPVPLSHVWIALDHLGRVQTIFYKNRLPAAAAHTKWRHVWGDDPPERVRKALEGSNPWEILDFLHIVTPRGNRNPDEFGPGERPWRSIHIAVDDRALIEGDSGYFEMPYIFARDMVATSEIYGRGAGMIVLPEMGTLNEQKKTFLKSGIKVAAPPLLAGTESSLGGRNVSLVPDALNFGWLDSKGEPLVKPIQTGARLDLTREMMQDEIQAIDDSFSLTLFRLLLEDPRSGVTAFEIAQRMQEKGELIGPAIDAIQSEMFGLETERLVGMMDRIGAMPEIPEVVLEAGGYQIQYTSPANQLQRAGEASAILRTMDSIAPLASVDPGIYRKFRQGVTVDRLMEIYGGPTDVLVPEDEYEEMRAAEAEAAQMAQQAEMMQQGAGTLREGAQALQLLQGGGNGAA